MAATIGKDISIYTLSTYPFRDPPHTYLIAFMPAVVKSITRVLLVVEVYSFFRGSD